MDNFISQELGGLCLILWAVIGIGFIWYVHKIKKFNAGPDHHQDHEETKGDIATHLAENFQIPEAYSDLHETNTDSSDQPTQH